MIATAMMATAICYIPLTTVNKADYPKWVFHMPVLYTIVLIMHIIG